MILKVAFLDCKAHGDCTVITFDEGDRTACMVIDCGDKNASATALRKYLIDEGIDTIDLMVGTHIDQDHIWGLYVFVREEYKRKAADKDYIMVKEFWGSQPSQTHSPVYEPTDYSYIGELESAEDWQNLVIQSVGQNDDLYDELLNIGAVIKHPALDDSPDNPFHNIKLELLGPDTQIPSDTILSSMEGITSRASGDIEIDSLDKLKLALSENRKTLAIAAKRNANNQSIVLRLTPATNNADANKWSFLFTGDAEEEAWDGMLADPEVKSKLKAKVLKIPHHGSFQNGITANGANKVKPDISVNLVGQKHGLPDEETLSLLHNMSSKIYCPQRNGKKTKKHKSACYDVSASKCPAYDNPKTVIFELDTDNGKMNITPPNRACKNNW